VTPYDEGSPNLLGYWPRKFSACCKLEIIEGFKPELYLAHVDRAIAEFTSSENCPFTVTGLVYPIDLLASGMD
jgi:hypothetical protein